MYLDFIKDDILINSVLEVYETLENELEKFRDQKYLTRNSLDPFDFIFKNDKYENWVYHEKLRQIGKTISNKIGNFHETILGNVYDFKVINQGHDIQSDKKKIIADVKNKHNTVKGSDRIGLAKFLQSKIDSKFFGYKAYVVEIIPKDKKKYCEIFSASDRLTGKRIYFKDVYKIDGLSFYELATGYKNAIYELYKIIPIILEKEKGLNFSFDILKPFKLSYNI